ncbi:hypothetical protein FRB95_007011 [Tulasnella sp. JGI-2019a]|nr:hypothetical protein FRB95_007011 [Tulasnella sp. JGI-2019a]
MANISAEHSKPPLTTPLLSASPITAGTGSASGHLPNLLYVKAVGPWIARNILNNEHCEFEKFLQVLLHRSTRSPKAELPQLQPFLDAVTSACNDLKPDLKSYSDVAKPGKLEAKLYVPFVKLANKALEKVRTTEVKGHTLHTDIEQLLFHVSDPGVMQAKHYGDTSYRKPDIMLVSLRTARDAGRDTRKNASWDDFAFKDALEAPKKPFAWGDSRVPVKVEPYLFTTRIPGKFEPKTGISTSDGFGPS